MEAELGRTVAMVAARFVIPTAGRLGCDNCLVVDVRGEAGAPQVSVFCHRVLRGYPEESGYE